MKAEQNLRWRLKKTVAWAILKIESQISLSYHSTALDFTRLNLNITFDFIKCHSTCRTVGPLPPKYQNWPIKVAPHPRAIPTPSPNSKFKCSFIFPKQFMISVTCYNLTIKVYNHWLIIWIISVQNQNSLSSRSRTCRRGSLSCCRGSGSSRGRSCCRWWRCSCCDIRRGWCLPTGKIITRTPSWTISLNFCLFKP